VQAREFLIILNLEADPGGDADRLWHERSQPEVPQHFLSHRLHHTKALEVCHAMPSLTQLRVLQWNAPDRNMRRQSRNLEQRLC